MAAARVCGGGAAPSPAISAAEAPGCLGPVGSPAEAPAEWRAGPTFGAEDGNPVANGTPGACSFRLHPAGGTTWTMLPHRPQGRMAPMAASSRTTNIRWHVGQAMEKRIGSTLPPHHSPPHARGDRPGCGVLCNSSMHLPLVASDWRGTRDTGQAAGGRGGDHTGTGEGPPCRFIDSPIKREAPGRGSAAVNRGDKELRHRSIRWFGRQRRARSATGQ